MSESSPHPSVTAAVDQLDRIGELPAPAHVEIYEEVHRALQDALADAARAPSARQGAVGQLDDGASGVERGREVGEAREAREVDGT